MTLLPPFPSLNVLLTINSSAHNSFCSFSAPLSSFFSFTLYLLHIVFLAFVLSPYCCCLHFILPKLIFYTYHVIWLVWLMAPCLGVYLSLCLFVGFHNSVYMCRLLASSWISLCDTHDGFLTTCVFSMLTCIAVAVIAWVFEGGGLFICVFPPCLYLWLPLCNFPSERTWIAFYQPCMDFCIFVVFFVCLLVWLWCFSMYILGDFKRNLI